MPEFFSRLKEFFLNILFPPYCLNCQRDYNPPAASSHPPSGGWAPGSYLCQDCLSLIEIADRQYCPFCQSPKIVLDARTCWPCRQKGKKLAGLFSATPYQNFIIKKVISQFKYEPCVKELSKSLAALIIQHFQLLEKKPDFSQAILVPVPLSKKRLKWRGFNQAESIAQELFVFFKIPLVSDVLLKTKETLPQVELSGKEREESIKGVFVCKNPEAVKGRKILLVDDIFTTGSTMEECARVLKNSGAGEVWGIVVARE